MVAKFSECRASVAWTVAAFLLGHTVYLSHALGHSATYEGVTEVEEGFPFEISCKIKTRDILQWTIDGQKIPEQNEAGYIFITQKTGTFDILSTLSAASAQMYHQGEYRCNGYSRDFHFLRVILGEEEEDDGDREKEDADDDGQKSSNVIILQKHEKVTFVCPTADDENIPIIWYKNGAELVSNGNVHINGGSLVINDAQQGDAAEYRCIKNVAYYSKSRNIGQIFHLKSPAEVMEFSENISVIKGRTVTLKCIASGFPKPRITWFINNVNAAELKKNDLRISIHEENITFFIHNMTSSDTGKYTCRAKNSMDGEKTTVRSETSAFVHVRENMIKTNEDEPGMGKLLVPGQQLILHCNTTDCLQCTVIWFKNGLNLSSVVDDFQIYDDNNSLVIHKATYDHSGIYVCAINETQLMDVILNASISVQSEIKLEKFDQSSVVIQGNPLELECKAKGAPTPKIKWFKGSDKISTSDRIKLLDHGDLKNAKLLIEEADFDDRDYYTCEAYNNIVSVNTTIFVRVKDKLAALWPFLGICAEVAILCSIIFVYERRKSKSQFDESDTDHPSENKNTRDQMAKGQDVRQRK